MMATVVGVQGHLAGRVFTISNRPITFGRGEENDIVLADSSASRLHAEVRPEGDGYVLQDRGSSNGTWVNGATVSTSRLQSGDQIVIGDEVFRFEAPGTQSTVQSATARAADVAVVQAQAQGPRLRVTISGGGPVGLSFALLLEHLMGSRVAIRIYESRWIARRRPDRLEGTRPGQRTPAAGRDHSEPSVPEAAAGGAGAALHPGAYTEMWPSGPDSIQDLGPRNVRIAYVEDQLARRRE